MFSLSLPALALPLTAALMASASPVLLGRDDNSTFTAPEGFNVTYQSPYNSCVADM